MIEEFKPLIASDAYTRFCKNRLMMPNFFLSLLRQKSCNVFCQNTIHIARKLEIYKFNEAVSINNFELLNSGDE